MTTPTNDIPELQEHYLRGGDGTQTACSCGKSFGLASDAQQHIEWQLALSAKDKQHAVELVEAFKKGQRIGQYQAADKLYSHTTTMWLFKDDPANPKAEMSGRINELLKDCEKLLNHNSKAYKVYLSELNHQKEGLKDE